MGTLRDVGQKIKGKAQQAKGNLKQNTGDNTGVIDKVKGKANETVADIKLNIRRERAKGVH